MDEAFIDRLYRIHFEISTPGKRGYNDDQLLTRVRRIKEKWSNKDPERRKLFNETFNTLKSTMNHR